MPACTGSELCIHLWILTSFLTSGTMCFHQICTYDILSPSINILNTHHERSDAEILGPLNGLLFLYSYLFQTDIDLILELNSLLYGDHW